MSIFDRPIDIATEGEPGEWDHDSMAVVACDGSGHGCVLWTTGPHVQHEMTEGGLKELCDLGLDDAPLGISIWIGKYLTIQVSDGDYGREYDVEPKGSFRAPTEEEWSAIRQGRSPWDFPASTKMYGGEDMIG